MTEQVAPTWKQIHGRRLQSKSSYAFWDELTLKAEDKLAEDALHGKHIGARNDAIELRSFYNINEYD